VGEPGFKLRQPDLGPKPMITSKMHLLINLGTQTILQPGKDDTMC
jgi:hypothetical protein